MNLPLLKRYTDKWKFQTISITKDPCGLVSGGYVRKVECFQIYPVFGWVEIQVISKH